MRWRRRREDDLDRELRAHLELEETERREKGLHLVDHQHTGGLFDCFVENLSYLATGFMNVRTADTRGIDAEGGPSQIVD